MERGQRPTIWQFSGMIRSDGCAVGVPGSVARSNPNPRFADEMEIKFGRFWGISVGFFEKVSVPSCIQFCLKIPNMYHDRPFGGRLGPIIAQNRLKNRLSDFYEN